MFVKIHNIPLAQRYLAFTLTFTPVISVIFNALKLINIYIWLVPGDGLLYAEISVE